MMITRIVSFCLLALAAGLIVAFVLLGNWQMHRLEWKTALIAAAESRAYGKAVEAPLSQDWVKVGFDTHAYLRVQATGRLLHEHEMPIKAVTGEAPGYWIMTPLLRHDGTILWINRGYVPVSHKNPSSRPADKDDTGPVTVSGLLRLSEPDGTLLERNQPSQGRWVSRDVFALSKVSGLDRPAPYFIDADHRTDQISWPRGGMTVLTFRNNHLSYALTWYCLAIGLSGALIYVILFRKDA